MPNYTNKTIFREICGIWRRVDSQEPKPQTLAEYLKELQIIIDENAQFVRIRRYAGKEKEYIEYRAYGGKVTINYTKIKI